jgi:peptide deformylase
MQPACAPDRSVAKKTCILSVGRGNWEIESANILRYGMLMTIKPLIILPDPILRQVSKPVETIDSSILRLADDMLETMYDAPGIGLAAIQIGVPRRLLVIDLAKEGEDKAPQVFINPEILTSSDDRSTYEEGCLSIPDYYAEVERPAQVTVRHLDRNGKEILTQAEGLLATCLQHEIDHLNGVLFIDHISRLKREMVIKKFTKAARA